MNILVVDVAASESGAMSILKMYYNELLNDTDNRYYFCVSTPLLESKKNITVLPFGWVKKSWFHRLWFDNVICGKLIKKYKIDKILSLQNTAVPHTDIPQTIYLHLSLPFIEYRFSFFENKLFWIYQNVIGKLIYKSVKRADRVIVQTQWMKSSIISKCNVDGEKITIIPPVVDLKLEKNFDLKFYNNTFFYPATNHSYKNHLTILKAVKLLKEQGIFDFKVIFTLQEHELPIECVALFEEVKDYLVFVGTIPREEVLLRYCESVLLFASYIETFGLPLLEARMCNAPVIASDMPFSREILDGYDKCDFFIWNDAVVLSELMRKWIY